MNGLDALARFTERRLSGIGASDAPIVLGLSPYMAPLQLKALKRGEVDPPAETEAMRLGLLLEPVVAKLAEVRLATLLDRPVRLSARNRFRRRPGSPWQFCHVDRWLGTVPVELKTAPYSGASWGDEADGERGVPPMYRAQVQHQIAVTGATHAYLCVLIAGSETRLYRIDRNDRAIEAIDMAEREFWRAVREDLPVEAGPADEAYLRQQYPVDTEPELVATAEQTFIVERLFAAQAEQKAAEHDFQDARAKLIQALGPHSAMIGPGFEITYRASERRTVAWEAVAVAYRRIAEALHSVALQAASSIAVAGVDVSTPEKLEEALGTIHSLNTNVDKVRTFRPTRTRKDG